MESGNCRSMSEYKQRSRRSSSVHVKQIADDSFSGSPLLSPRSILAVAF